MSRHRLRTFIVLACSLGVLLLPAAAHAETPDVEYARADQSTPNGGWFLSVDIYTWTEDEDGYVIQPDPPNDEASLTVTAGMSGPTVYATTIPFYDGNGVIRFRETVDLSGCVAAGCVVHARIRDATTGLYGEEAVREVELRPYESLVQDETPVTPAKARIQVKRVRGGLILDGRKSRGLRSDSATGAVKTYRWQLLRAKSTKPRVLSRKGHFTWRLQGIKRPATYRVKLTIRDHRGVTASKAVRLKVTPRMLRAAQR